MSEAVKRRHSKKREAILVALQNHHGALSAADIHGLVPEIDLVTVYRNLEVFVADKLVRKLHLGQGTEAVYEYAKEAHHHAICADCDEVIHFTAPNKKIIELLGLKDFEVDELEVIVKGRHLRSRQ